MILAARSVLTRLQPLACLLGLSLVGLITVVGKLIEPFDLGSDLIEVTLSYLMAVLFLAVRFGLWPALLTSAISVGTLDFLFLPPLYTFNVDTPQDAVLLAFFAVLAITTSRLAGQLREHVIIVRHQADTMLELFRFAERLAATVTLDDAIGAAERQVETMLAGRATVSLGASPPAAPPGLSLPLHAAGETIGAMIVEPAGGAALTEDNRRLLDALVELTGIAIGRQQLADHLAQLGIEQEADRLRSALLNSIAHDLTAPISSLASVLGSLSSGYRGFDDDTRRELIAEAEQEADYLHRFSANLVNMTRLETGAIELQRRPVEVGELVEHVLARARAILEPRRIIVDVAPSLPRLRVDVVLIEQAIFNILENAAKYTPPEATVTICAREDQGRVSLIISDNGPGFPAADRERLFAKFYRSPAGREQDHGTGLGLAIARGFVEAHGGTISAANRADGSGAVFTIRLPTTLP